MDITDREFADNFKVNMYLSNIMDNMKDEMEYIRAINWKENITPEMQEALNRITFAVKNAMEVSNKHLRLLELK